ncbi:MAG: OmpA family protein [Stagnimonas sp.]|nr:OmpA family protein [Stagnimonas sp.]
MSAARRAAALVLGSLLAACAGAPERVVLLPGADGKVGRINVVPRDGGAAVLLESAYAGAAAGATGIRPQASDADDVQQDFDQTLKALPRQPSQHLLYFQGDSTTLDAESQARLPQVLSEVAGYPAPELVVIGHTDRVGALEYNDQLGLARARVVRAALIAMGIDAARISLSSRGEREPRIATGDEVAEPGNRRVELSVR